MQTKNNTHKNLILIADLPQDLKEQLLKEFQEIEKQAIISELKLKNKEEEINVLNQTIKTLKKDSNISQDNIQELDNKFNKKKLQDSHELKTLIDVIFRMSCFLKNSNLNDLQKKYINTIQRSTEDILTNLNLSHLNTKEIEIHDNCNVTTSKKIAQSVTNIQKEEEAFPDHWKTFKFLMIEDNRADIILFKCIFKLWGLHLDVVTSLQEAKEKLQEKYDCILSDVVLPDGNGLGHIYELRINEQAVNQNTPVIILTANASKSGAKMAQEANVQYYFSKPFSLKLLRDGLQQIFNPKKSSKRSIKVVLDAKNTWTWYEVLSYHLNGRDHFIKEFMGIFLIQARNINALFSQNIKVENIDALQYEIYKFKSTVHTIGLRDTYSYLTKISQEVKMGVDTENLNILIADFRVQLKTDIEDVESKVEEHSTELSMT
ncbi:MAG: response regulator [Saprospiraceae bacterium]